MLPVSFPVVGLKYGDKSSLKDDRIYFDSWLQRDIAIVHHSGKDMTSGRNRRLAGDIITLH